MTLTEILEQIRGLYLEEFSARLEGFPVDVRRVLLAEALYLNAEGDALRTGALQLPARGDLCVLQDQRVQEIACIEASRSVRFDAFRFVWDNRVQVALNPFAWSNCSVCIPEPIEALDVVPLVAWFEQQLKTADAIEVSDRFPKNVAHSLSAPRQSPAGVRFEVDFGSMPVAGFERFLAAVAEAGAGLLVIGELPANATPLSHNP